MKIRRSDNPRNVSDSQKIAHINGRYSIIRALIALAGTALASSSITISLGFSYLNNSNYVSPKVQETISQQTADMQSLQSLYSDLQTQYVALEESTQNLQASYEAALAELESAQSKITALTAAQSSNIPVQNTGTPTNLTSLPILGNNNSSYNHVYNTSESNDMATSNLGDTFNSCISMRDHGNIDFFLDSAYQTLTFTLCMAEETRNIDDVSSSILIYAVEGNGDTETVQLLYTSPSITMGFIPMDIPPISVAGVDHLRISFHSDTSLYYNAPRVILGNPQLQ